MPQKSHAYLANEVNIDSMVYIEICKYSERFSDIKYLIH